MQYELHGLTQAHYRRIAPLRHQATDVIADIVAGGVTTGEFHVDNVDEVVMAISSLCVDVCRWFPSRTHRDAHKLGQGVRRSGGAAGSLTRLDVGLAR